MLIRHLKLTVWRRYTVAQRQAKRSDSVGGPENGPRMSRDGDSVSRHIFHLPVCTAALRSDHTQFLRLPFGCALTLSQHRAHLPGANNLMQPACACLLTFPLNPLLDTTACS